MSLSFAGTSLNVWSDVAETWANQTLELSDWFPANLNDDTYRQLSYLPLPPFEPDEGPAEVGKLHWPRYASRWSTAFYPVDKTRLDAIRSAVGPTNTPQLLFIGNGTSGTELVQATMYMLPPRPISAVQTTEYGGDLWVLPLVDQRYWWWYKLFSTDSFVQSLTWDAFLNNIAQCLGVTFYGDTTIEASYGFPTNRWANIKNAPACLILDAVMETLQRRVHVKFNGEVWITRPETAQTAQTVAYNTFRSKIVAGGLSDPSDVARAVPASVAVQFGTQFGNVYSSSIFTHVVTLNDLYNKGLVSGYLPTPYGYPGATGSLMADGYAEWDYSQPCGLPTNFGEITSHSTRMAADWYSWRQGRLEAGYGTLSAWPVNGLTEEAIYRYRGGDSMLIVEAEPTFNPNVYGDYSVNDNESQPIPVCTTTTTVGPDNCEGECEWEYDFTTKEWIQLSSTCPDECECTYPQYCPPDLTPEVTTTVAPGTTTEAPCPNPTTITGCGRPSPGNVPALCNTTIAPTTVGPGTTTTISPCDSTGGWVYPVCCPTTTCAPRCEPTISGGPGRNDSGFRCLFYANPSIVSNSCNGWEFIPDDLSCDYDSRVPNSSFASICCPCSCPPVPSPRDCTYYSTACVRRPVPPMPCACCGGCRWMWVPEREGDGEIVPAQWVQIDVLSANCRPGPKIRCPGDPFTPTTEYWECVCSPPNYPGGFCAQIAGTSCYIPDYVSLCPPPYPDPNCTTLVPTTTPPPEGWCSGSCLWKGDNSGGWSIFNSDCVGEYCACLQPGRTSTSNCDTEYTGCGPYNTTTVGVTTTLGPFDCPDYDGDLCVRLTGPGCSVSANVPPYSGGWRGIITVGTCSLRVAISCSGGVWSMAYFTSGGVAGTIPLAGSYPNFTGTISGTPCCGGGAISVTTGLPGAGICTTTGGPTTTSAPCNCDDTAELCLKISGDCPVNLDQIAWKLYRTAECQWNTNLQEGPCTCLMGNCNDCTRTGASLYATGSGCGFVLAVYINSVLQLVPMSGTLPALTGSVDLSACGCGTGTAVTSIDATCSATGCTTTAGPTTTTTTVSPTTTTTPGPGSTCGTGPTLTNSFDISGTVSSGSPQYWVLNVGSGGFVSYSIANFTGSDMVRMCMFTDISCSLIYACSAQAGVGCFNGSCGGSAVFFPAGTYYLRINIEVGTGPVSYRAKFQSGTTCLCPL